MKSVSILFLALLTVGCGMTAAQHSRSLGSSQEREMTVGIVQKDIKEGMNQADVAQSLGSPNIVTRDSGGSETWIYDKIASEASYSESSSGVRSCSFSLVVGKRQKCGRFFVHTENLDSYYQV